MSTPIPLKGVSHVSINVSDMERSVAFYRDVLGWDQLFDDHMAGESFEAITGVPGAAGQACGGRIGDLRVELMCFNYTPIESPAPGLGLRVLSLEVPDAAEAHLQLSARGAAVSGPPVELHGTRMFFVFDPDRQGIELVEYIPGGPAWGGAYR